MYSEGGLYLDNDVVPLAGLPDAVAGPGAAPVTTVLEESKKYLFQAILAAPPRSDLVRRALIYFEEWVCGARAATRNSGGGPEGDTCVGVAKIKGYVNFACYKTEWAL